MITLTGTVARCAAWDSRNIETRSLIVPPSKLKFLVTDLLLPTLDLLMSPATLAAALLLKTIRRVGVYRMRVSRRIFNTVGVFPIRDHYYEPQFNPAHLRRPIDAERALPGIDLNRAGQLELLERFSFADELARFPELSTDPLEYRYRNDNFGAGDAEFFYSMIRLFKPARIIEIGSGMSTLMARNAIDANRIYDPSYHCRHTCIEPFEMPWLERLPGVDIVRKRVEDVEMGMFDSLETDDILFIDSSHVIRPQGDVLFEYLELLPRLATGVFIHVHDIFTPRDYPATWLVDQVRLWNEQYLLEAFLSNNAGFKVVAALNYLHHRHPGPLHAALPVLGSDPVRFEPGSFWIQRTPA